MRIIAGEFRSRILAAPKGKHTRPTTDRARESLFNVLQNRISFDNADVLDLFCGSGALGFEALSRGARSVVLIDISKEAIAAVTANAKALGVEDRVSIVKGDVYELIGEQNSQFGIIFADPPYDDERTLTKLPLLIAASGLLSDDSIVILEHRSGTRITAPDGLTVAKEISAGEAHFTLLTPNV